jgi:hypothetical protein
MKAKYEMSRWPWRSYRAYVLKMNQDALGVEMEAAQETVADTEAEKKAKDDALKPSRCAVKRSECAVQRHDDPAGGSPASAGSAPVE